MDQNARDYLKTEIEYFQKNVETQFTHFMGVFYFWTAVVVAPVTAGLVKKDEIDDQPFGILLLLIAILGLFLAAKMFDIRASQLRYITYLNRARNALFDLSKEGLPKCFKHPYPPSDLRPTAFHDFGIIMASTMSLMNGVFFGFAIPFLHESQIFNWWAFIAFALFGFLLYVIIIFLRAEAP